MTRIKRPLACIHLKEKSEPEKPKKVQPKFSVKSESITSGKTHMAKAAAASNAVINNIATSSLMA